MPIVWLRSLCQETRPADLYALEQLPFYAGHLTKNKRNKNKRWYHSTGTVFIRRGPRDHVRAHYSKRDMVVELYVCRSRGATWLPEPVEQEIFQQLNKGGLNIEPLEDMGFLDFLDNSVSAEISCTLPSIINTFTARILVRYWPTT